MSHGAVGSVELTGFSRVNINTTKLATFRQTDGVALILQSLAFHYKFGRRGVKTSVFGKA